MGIGIAGQERDETTEQEGEYDGVTRHVHGEAENGEDPTADHAADANGHDLEKSEFFLRVLGHLMLIEGTVENIGDWPARNS